MWAPRLCTLFAVSLLAGPAPAGDKMADRSTAEKISFYRQVRPIFQASCQGCHQPAKAGGGYVMTSLAALLKGGDTGEPAVVPGKPDDSNLLSMITPADGKADMPKGRPPLAAGEIALVRRWIQQGAADDTPPGARARIDARHPPLYARPPVIASLDFSSDGRLLVIAGFHEVLLWKSDGSRRLARLVGMSDRIESVRFSPDGSQLAAVGGNPCRMGEVQVWNVAAGKLSLSLPLTYDTLYGGCWSPDGKLIAFGGADNAVRAIDAATSKPLLFMAAHEDWVRGTAFSRDGKLLCSVSRDMTVKMTDLATQRFLGNVTTHTPGVLRGGMLAIARHPLRDEILVGGADGVPKLFRMEVKAAPASGGNPNQIREFEALPGRVFDVRFNPDGSRIFAAGTLDGKAQVRCYETDSGKRLWQLDVPETALYALACAADGKTVAVAGGDGQIRLIDAIGGKIGKRFLPVEITPSAGAAGDWFAGPEAALPPVPAVTAPPAEPIVRLDVEPSVIRFTRPTDYAQVLLTGTLTNGTRVDATRLARWTVEGDLGQVTSGGRFTPAHRGTGKLLAALSGRRWEIPIELEKLQSGYAPDFVRDVNPIMTRLGCNAGTCHGAAKGKNGFKLSLRGYDPPLDIRALTDDLASRRVNTASPDDSLMLLKATAAVPHQGGQVITPDSTYYRTLRQWIANGARLDTASPRAARIDVLPRNPVVERIGDTQQMRIVAAFADGTTRDVTREAFIEGGNTEVIAADRNGVMTAVRRGESPVLARYDGTYAATTLTVMGDRGGFVWQAPETWGKIDELVAAKWQRMKILPSPLCGDAEFLRRVSLDLTGLPPTAAEVRAFLHDPRPTRVKRDERIAALIGSEAYIEHWTNKWADLLQVNRKFLGAEGAAAFRGWIRGQIAANTPYREFVAKILTASGSNRENPPASYFKILRDPRDTMENTTHLFLAVRFNCNKCHDHPFERWTQDQYYQTAAFLARVDFKPDPASGARKIAGTAVEGAKALYEVVYDKDQGEVLHERTKAVAPPRLPFPARYDRPPRATRRQEFAAWLTSPDNPYFARSYVNRLWGYLLGAGLIEPLDDVRAGNPPTNPELLDYLAAEFVRSGFDVRYVIGLICRSRAYQLSIETNRWNEDDRINYAHALARRLPAEVLYDAIHRATGSIARIPGVPPGTRAAALPDSGINVPDGFLNNLGRPARESACECERSSGLQLGPVMALISGPTVEQAVSDPDSELARLVAAEQNDTRLIDEIFLRVLGRPASPQEIAQGLSALESLPKEHRQLAARLERRERELASTIAAQARQRLSAIDRAGRELAAYEKEIAPRQSQQERQRQQRIAQAESALADSRQRLPQRLARWEPQVKHPTVWTPLDPIELSATGGVRLTKQRDLSVLADGSPGRVAYQFVARTGVTGVTGIKLEALADDRLPGKGPGRAPNGNFVLTAFRVAWAPQTAPNERRPVALEKARADFSQDGFGVQLAIEARKADRRKGWATVPKTGRNHTAVFQTRENVGAGPGILTFTLDHQYDEGHVLGRFRISVTNFPRPITLDGLPKNIADILAVAPARCSDAQKADLLRYYAGVDEELSSRQQALAAARQPPPVDAKLQAFRDALAEVSRPVPIDPLLAQLRGDFRLSADQLAKSRLTFAQDLAWALINSPAFLFNR
jgi:mono/diheme cytochrome c family protein